jgi:hypothetical protein
VHNPDTAGAPRPAPASHLRSADHRDNVSPATYTRKRRHDRPLRRLPLRSRWHRPHRHRLPIRHRCPPRGDEVLVIRARAPTTPAGTSPRPWPAPGYDAATTARSHSTATATTPSSSGLRPSEPPSKRSLVRRSCSLHGGAGPNVQAQHAQHAPRLRLRLRRPRRARRWVPGRGPIGHGPLLSASSLLFAHRPRRQRPRRLPRRQPMTSVSGWPISAFLEHRCGRGEPASRTAGPGADRRGEGARVPRVEGRVRCSA